MHDTAAILRRVRLAGGRGVFRGRTGLRPTGMTTRPFVDQLASLANHRERVVTTFFEHPALLAAGHALLSKQMCCPPGASAPICHVPSAVDEAPAPDPRET